MFRHQDPAGALEFYNEYLDRYSEGHLAPDAMLKKGLIQRRLGRHRAARATLQQLVIDYPASPLALEAKRQLLQTLFADGKYQESIGLATDFLKTAKSKAFVFHINILLGDSYSMIGAYASALDAYLTAFSQTVDTKDEKIMTRIASAAKRIEAKTIVDILIRYQDVLPVQDLIYRLGLSKFNMRMYEDAKELLSTFVSRYPTHADVQKSKDLIREIDKKFIFRRNTIGCLLPLSGSHKIYGDRMLQCIELALARFSSQHHVSQIKLIIKDTKSDPETAVLSVKELASERVGAIIGPISAACEAAAEQAQKERIPIITFSQKENITAIGDYVFRNFITPELQIESLVSYAANRLGLSRFAVLYPDDRYGNLFKTLFLKEVAAYQGKIVAIEPYQTGQTDFAQIIKKIAGLSQQTHEHLTRGDRQKTLPQVTPALDFEAVFIPDGPSAAGLIIPQLVYYDVVGVQLLGTNIWHSKRLIEMAGQFVQDAILVDGFFTESKSQKVKNFVDDFAAIFDEEPGFIEAVAYDTAMMLFALISRDDIRSRIELRDELMNLHNFKGVTGTISFDHTGGAERDLYILQIKGDTFVDANEYLK